MTNPQIAMACLLGIIVAAGLYVVGEYSKRRNELPAGHDCFPPTGRFARR
jgi:hypothetical protein